MPTSNTHTPKPTTEMTEDTKSVITVLLLLTITPVGIVLMWVWTKWQTWVKALVTGCTCLPIILFIMIMIIGIIASADEVEKNNRVPLAPSSTVSSSTNNSYSVNGNNVNTTTVNNLSVYTDVTAGYTVSYSGDDLVNCIDNSYSPTLTLYLKENIGACSYEPTLPYAVKVSTQKSGDDYLPYDGGEKATITLDGYDADMYTYSMAGGKTSIIMAKSPSSNKVVIIELNSANSAEQAILDDFIANFSWTGRE